MEVLLLLAMQPCVTKKEHYRTGSTMQTTGRVQRDLFTSAVVLFTTSESWGALQQGSTVLPVFGAGGESRA